LAIACFQRRTDVREKRPHKQQITSRLLHTLSYEFGWRTVLTGSVIPGRDRVISEQNGLRGGGPSWGELTVRRTNVIAALPLLLAILVAAIHPVNAQQSTSSDTSASAPQAAGELSEVVVTAQRRSENLQSVPIAIDVVTATEAIKVGVFDNMSLMTQVPGLQSSRQVTGATLYLRGVGTIAAPGVENGVATYVDDVYQNGFSGTILAFNNIDRVEVLKGPQGTLFGRNATGGVIHIVTKEPSQQSQLDMQVGYGNYQTWEANLYGTTGIGKNLAIDIAYHSREQNEGWGRDLTTGQEINLGKEYGVRSKLLWTPSDALSVELMVDHYWDNYDYGSNQTSVPGTLSAGLGTFAGDYNTQGDNPYSPYGPGRSGHDRHVDSESLTVGYDFGWATLKSITARRMVRDFTAYDQDGGPGHYNDARWPSTTEYYTQEFRLTSPTSSQFFHWVAGFFWLKMNDEIALQTSGGVTGAPLFPVLPYPTYTGFGAAYTHSYSGFFDTTFSVTSKTNLTLGIRETADRIDFDSSTNFVPASGPPAFVTTFPESNADATKPTYRAIIEQNFTPDVMGYFSFSHGYKSGGFSLFGPGTAPTKPELVDAFALGMKTDWFDHRMRANAEAFYYDYTNQQVEVIESGAAMEINAASSHIYGLDLELDGKATDNLTLTANMAYLHGRYESFPSAPVYIQLPATCTPFPERLPGPLQPGNLQCPLDVTGKPTIRSPEFSGVVGFDWLMFKGDLGSVDWTGNYYYTTKFDWDPSGQFPEPAYGLIATSFTWSSPADKYQVQLWCTNCGNTYHDTFIAESGPEQQKAPEAPRSYGIRLRVIFK